MAYLKLCNGDSVRINNREEFKDIFRNSIFYTEPDKNNNYFIYKRNAENMLSFRKFSAIATAKDLGMSDNEITECFRLSSNGNNI